jgi:hypothetical protein
MAGPLLLCLILALVSGVLSVPFMPYVPPTFGSGKAEPRSVDTTLKLRRAEALSDIHPLIARAQAVNRAYKKFGKRSGLQ